MQKAAEPSRAGLPLCVDLDGTLVRTDTLVDGCLSLMRQGFDWLQIPIWLFHGKAHLKKQVAQRAAFDATTLPYHEGVLQELRQAQAAGREIVLCTGSDEVFAHQVAQHLGIFSEVVASDGRRNLVGRHKADALGARFGKGNFEYLADSSADIPVWKLAGKAHLVNPSPGLLRTLKKSTTPLGNVFPRTGAGARLRSWIRALRIHQWLKNLLVLLPLALAHRLDLWPGLLAFIAFGAAASSGYIINDLLDLAHDRRHATKKRRPFASGALPSVQGAALVPVLLAVAGLLAWRLPPAFAWTLLAYFLGSLSYSLWLKRIELVDVLTLAGLYVIRITAGGAATGIVISPWTLAASAFLFLSLATAKRAAELGKFQDDGTSVPGRGYLKADLQIMTTMGACVGYLSILVTALYISSPDVEKLYQHPQRLWFLLPVQMYWISRLWLFTVRGRMNQDPVVFALTDRNTYIAGVLAALVGLSAI